MRNLLKKPLPWMIVAECAVVSALVFVAWHMFSGPSREATASPPLPIAAAATDDLSNPPTAASPSPPSPAARLQLPGLNLDTDFWRLRLLELNKEEVVFEQLEWRIVHSTMDTIHRYLDTVVLPGIARAERGGG